MLTTIIGLASTAITKGIEKANSKISQINTDLTNKKIEELTALGLIPSSVTGNSDTVSNVADAGNNTAIVFVGVIIAIIAILKK
ncbi:MAG: hypothetical protein QM763_03135 [Agriterribacter sp.]